MPLQSWLWVSASTIGAIALVFSLWSKLRTVGKPHRSRLRALLFYVLIATAFSVLSGLGGWAVSSQAADVSTLQILVTGIPAGIAALAAAVSAGASVITARKNKNQQDRSTTSRFTGTPVRSTSAGSPSFSSSRALQKKPGLVGLRRFSERGAEDRIASLRAENREYVESLAHIVGRGVPTFSDSFQMFVLVGADDDSDLIVQRWKTEPQPIVTYHPFLLSHPTELSASSTIDDLELSMFCDSAGAITPLLLASAHGGTRVCAVFNPPATTSFEWQVEHRPRGLWRPLRERGYGRLSWQDDVGVTVYGTNALTKISVEFIFQYGNGAPPKVIEQSGFGETREAELRNDKTWKIDWHDANPAGRRYQWELGLQQPRLQSGRQLGS